MWLIHTKNLVDRFGEVYQPDALERKSAGRTAMGCVPGRQAQYRSPLQEGTAPSHRRERGAEGRQIRAAVRKAGIDKPAGCHTRRDAFATHLLERGMDIGTVQEQLGYKDVRTTQIYTHVIQWGDRRF